MAHKIYNHFNPEEFKKFVPEASKLANRRLMNTIVLTCGISISLWALHHLYMAHKYKSKVK